VVARSRPGVLSERRVFLRRGAASLALLISNLGLAACGFRPLYGGRAGGTAATDLASVQISANNDRLGQILRNDLIERLSPLGEPRSPRYSLRATLSESSAALAIQQDTTITRYDQRIDVSFVLVDLATGQIVFQGGSRAIGGYDAVRSDFATLTAEQDAARRTVREVAEDIRAQLAAFFAGRQGGS
jgi:LPS-assembly lipoprotein